MKAWTYNTSICPGQPAAAPGGHVFTSKADLMRARTEWCVDKYAAAATYGPINEWDVSQITDLSNIFCASGQDPQGCFDGCSRAMSNTMFNDDISAWTTSAVTTLQASSTA